MHLIISEPLKINLIISEECELQLGPNNLIIRAET